MSAPTETVGATGADRARFSRRQFWSLVVISSAIGLDQSSLAVVNAALPDIGKDLAISATTLQWMVTGYAVTFGGFLLLGGRLADVFSRRAIFALGIAVFTVGALASAVAPNAGSLIVARAFQGVGAAFSVPSALALLTQVFPEGPLRNKAIGVYTSVGAGSFSAGLISGGVLTGLSGWRSVFVFNAVVGALVFVGARTVLPAGVRHDRPLDVPGAVLVTAGLLLVVFGVNRSADAGWSDAGTIGGLAAGAVLVAAFVLWERRTAEPLLPMELFRSRSVRASTVAAVVFFGVVIALLFFSPLYMQGILGFSPLESGLGLVPMSITVIITANLAGKLLSRGVSARVLMAAGTVTIGVGLLVFMLSRPDGDYLLDYLPGVAIMGTGQGFCYAALTVASLSGVPERIHGVASAFNNTAQQFGASIGTVALVAVATASTTGTGDAQVLKGYHSAYLTAALAAFVGAAVIMLVAGSAKRSAAREPDGVPAAVGDGA
ncbi:MFS transporter [Actinomadura oligospora]|uniref:MFS transporter n=1 Tax=Actinomadura oligospora TaxID=111804 RepID=UPI0004B35ECC|nr:MFS transporter [Actinomadura oligospora]